MLIKLTLYALLLAASLPMTAPAQNAAPADRNPVNTTTRPGGMAADSPVIFPKAGALPAKFPPDMKEESWPVEKDYHLFSSPCRSLAQIRKIQADMPDGKFTPPVNDWKNLTRTRRLLNESGTLHLMAVGVNVPSGISAWIFRICASERHGELKR